MKKPKTCFIKYLISFVLIIAILPINGTAFAEPITFDTERVTYSEGNTGDLIHVGVCLADSAQPAIFKVIKLFSSYVNFKLNNNISKIGYIINQKNDETASARFGLLKSGYNGCGWVAAYNAATFLGIDIDARKIIYECERRGALACGLFGMQPFILKGLFEDWGYTVSTTVNTNEFDELATSSQVSILTYIHTNGLHTIMVLNTSEGFYGFNVYSNSKQVENLGYSLEEFASKGRKSIVLIGIN